MTDSNSNSKPLIKTRQPKKVTNSGIFDNLRPLPHPVEEIMGLVEPEIAPASFIISDPTQPNPTQPNPTQPNPTQIEKEEIPTVAPHRDFNRRANSLERDALPSGLFPGTSKKLYDALYLRTRGAVNPTRTIQTTKKELMQWSGIRSKNTMAVNLLILAANGLIIKQFEMGDHGGSIYEVMLPEELESTPQPNPTQPNPTQPNPTQKLGWDPSQKLGWVGLGNPIENKGTYEFPKTSFKTDEKNDDDEAFARLREALSKATFELTGRSPAAVEAARWQELAEVLVAELKIAAGRTTISSVPAFLAEHLRRRLWKLDKKQARAEGRELPDDSKLATSAERAVDCPDCSGSGWWYPNGLERGVAKCKHPYVNQGIVDGEDTPAS